MFIFFFALLAGFLRAFQGSGYLKTDMEKAAEYAGVELTADQLTIEIRLRRAVRFALKKILIPLSMAYPAFVLSGSYWIAGLVAAPYYWKIFTGTGGDMQAEDDGSDVCNPENCKEWKYFDPIADKMAAWSGKFLSWDYCERWGFSFGLLSGAMFMLPFLAVGNIGGALVTLLAYPIGNRYLDHRMFEFNFYFLYTFLFLLGL